MCRHTANAIIPISLDKPYVPVKTPPSPFSYSDVWKIMDVLLQKARGPVYQVDKRKGLLGSISGLKLSETG